MSQMTITEALAEIKTIEKRVQKKSEFILLYACHPEDRKDPLERQGGSKKLLEEERQSRRDLQDRVVAIRAAIQKKNLELPLTVNGTTRTIAEWLIWRRDISKQQGDFLTAISRKIHTTRTPQQNEVQNRLNRAAGLPEQTPVQLTVNIDEAVLKNEQEELETVLGELDGKLSLFNATQTIEI